MWRVRCTDGRIISPVVSYWMSYWYSISYLLYKIDISFYLRYNDYITVIHIRMDKTSFCSRLDLP